MALRFLFSTLLPGVFSAVPPAFPLTKTNVIYVNLNFPPCELPVCSRMQTAQNHNFVFFCSWPQQSPTQCHAGRTWFRLHQRKLHWCEWPLVTFYLWSLSQFYSIYILIWFAILVVAFSTKGFLMFSPVILLKMCFYFHGNQNFHPRLISLWYHPVLDFRLRQIIVIQIRAKRPQLRWLVRNLVS